VSCYDEEIKINPNGAITYYNKALVLYNLHKYEEMVLGIDVAMKLDPGDEDTKQLKERMLEELVNQLDVK